MTVMSVPIYVIVRDRLTWTRSLVEYLDKIPDADVVCVDNASTYPPLLAWYATRPCRVERVQNLGERSPWLSGVVHRDRAERYVVTDHDLDLSGVPHDLLVQMQETLKRHPRKMKAGLSLRLDDLPDTPITREARKKEQGFWERKNHDGTFEAPIDTTFAMYARGREKMDILGFISNSVRLGPPYVCRHLPWYLTERSLSEEDRYYLAHASRASTWKASFELHYGKASSATASPGLRVSPLHPPTSPVPRVAEHPSKVARPTRPAQDDPSPPRPRPRKSAAAPNARSFRMSRDRS